MYKFLWYYTKQEAGERIICLLYDMPSHAKWLPVASILYSIENRRIYYFFFTGSHISV